MGEKITSEIGETLDSIEEGTEVRIDDKIDAIYVGKEGFEDFDDTPCGCETPTLYLFEYENGTIQIDGSQYDIISSDAHDGYRYDLVSIEVDPDGAPDNGPELSPVDEYRERVKETAENTEYDYTYEGATVVSVVMEDVNPDESARSVYGRLTDIIDYEDGALEPTVERKISVLDETDSGLVLMFCAIVRQPEIGSIKFDNQSNDGALRYFIEGLDDGVTISDAIDRLDEESMQELRELADQMEDQ